MCSHAHTIAYSDLRRALVALDGMQHWQLHELQSELGRAMRRCPAEGPPAQAAEHAVLQAFSDYAGAVLTEHLSSTCTVAPAQHTSEMSEG